jgi:predicted NAD-dependent protein-ADP-ribosyltransferase YbiA (DUF1768 family)
MASLRDEVSAFDATVKQKTDFCESDVVVYGAVGAASPLRFLSPLCRIPEGVAYPVNGKTHVFDTAEHVYQFLLHGVAGEVEMWARGGCMSTFEGVFGGDTASTMKTRHGDMIGVIPQLLIKPSRAPLRASLGLTLRTDETAASGGKLDDYDEWRPILHAVYASGEARQALLDTGTAYLINKDGSDEKWHGRITYPMPMRNEWGSGVKSEGAHPLCMCHKGEGNPKDCAALQEYNRQKKARARTGGVLAGNNRFGKYLMAIRAELALIVSSIGEPPNKKKKKGGGGGGGGA